MKNAPGLFARRALAQAMLVGPCLARVADATAQTAGASEQAVALDAVRRLGIGRNISLLALQVALRTQTFAIAASQLGPMRANALLAQHLAQSAPRFQDEWDSNLAAAHLERMMAPELASVAELGAASPAMPKLLAERGAIGAAMQSRSNDLLTRFVADVLAAVFQAMPQQGGAAGR